MLKGLDESREVLQVIPVNKFRADFEGKLDDFGLKLLVVLQHANLKSRDFRHDFLAHAVLYLS